MKKYGDAQPIEPEQEGSQGISTTAAREWSDQDSAELAQENQQADPAE